MTGSSARLCPKLPLPGTRPVSEPGDPLDRDLFLRATSGNGAGTSGPTETAVGEKNRSEVRLVENLPESLQVRTGLPATPESYQIMTWVSATPAELPSVSHTRTE